MLNNFLARKKLTEEQLNLCRDIRYVFLMGQCHENSLFNNILGREELTEEQLNLCRDIR